MEKGDVMKILVVVAHPDDEVLGPGGTILKHADKGDDIFVCVATRAFEPYWTKAYMERKIIEQRNVDRILGVKKRFNLDFPTTKLNAIPQGEFNRKVSGVVDATKPDIIYTHFGGDLNYDHKAVLRACLVSARPPKHIKVACFETLSETEWGNEHFQPNLWVGIEKHVQRKIKAFLTYESEVKKFPHPRSAEGIRVLAAKRGSEACLKYAEAFSVIKDTWR